MKLFAALSVTPDGVARSIMLDNATTRKAVLFRFGPSAQSLICLAPTGERNQFATDLCRRMNVGLHTRDVVKGSMVVIGIADDVPLGVVAWVREQLELMHETKGV